MDKIYTGDCKKGEIEILQSISIFRNRYTEIFNDQVRFPSGYDGTYVRVAAPCRASIAVLPVTGKGKIVLIRTFRHGMRGWCYEVPKGGIEPGESDETAALRELEEETGYCSQKLAYIGEYADSPAILSNRLKCYAALDCQKVSQPKPEHTEAIAETVEANISDVLSGRLRLDFNDAITELLIYKYQNSIGGK